MIHVPINPNENPLPSGACYPSALSLWNPSDGH